MSQPLIPITRKHALMFAAFLVLYEFLTYIANDMIMPGMIVGAAFFFLCTVFIACSNSIDQFLLARFFQGMGLCFIGVIGYASLQEIFSAMDAIRLIALMANVATIAPLVGPLLGAVFILYFSWRIIFVIIAAFSLVAFWGLWQYMPEPIGQVKHDGQMIEPVSLNFRVVLGNYARLLANKTFMLASVGFGLLSLPCIAWIALAPVILVNDAKLSIIQYALWQIPLFGALIFGTWYLQRLTHQYSVKKITLIGLVLSAVGLVLSWMLPFVLSGYFVWLMPGLFLYFFGLGVISDPLNRFILFSTSVGKGTASALTSMLTMCLVGVGIEIANHLYVSHNNIIFGGFCAVVGCVICVVVGLSFRFSSKSVEIEP